MIRSDIKRSSFYKELGEEERRKYFDYKQKQYLHNIDTLYYGIMIKNDKNGNENLVSFFEEFDIKKDELSKDYGAKVEYYGLSVKRGIYGLVYEYKLQEPDLFDIFFTHYLPNEQTPRIVVQLRSFGLWLHGVDEMIFRSYEEVKNILKNYDLEIIKTRENRIDYAFHTNIILNPYKFFSDRHLDKYLYTKFKKYYKIGDIRNKKRIPTYQQDKQEERFSLDYLGLGQLKSNNIFNRNYNKVKEVIEMNYKSFFIDLWYEKGLINYYDKWCIEFAYKKKLYNAIYEARLRFYLINGKNKLIKNEIESLLNKEHRFDDVFQMAKKYTPEHNIITNIEFQTKRKFYYYADKQIDLLPYRDRNLNYIPLQRIFKILDNRKMFLDYITDVSIAYIKKIEEVDIIVDGKKQKQKVIYYMDFWKRLRSLKLDCIDNKKYKRKYNNSLDLEKMIKRSINSVGTVALYNKKQNTGFVEDVADLLCAFNDNDVNKMDKHIDYDIMLIDKETGEIKRFDKFRNKKKIEEYQEYKSKKNKVIKNRLIRNEESVIKDQQQKDFDTYSKDSKGDNI